MEITTKQYRKYLDVGVSANGVELDLGFHSKAEAEILRDHLQEQVDNITDYLEEMAKHQRQNGEVKP